MKVVALQAGFFNKLREPGEEFEIPDGMQGSWFAPVKNEATSPGKPSVGGKASGGKAQPDSLV